MTPAEIQPQLEGSLAYTTVNTVLARLQSKGLVSRTRAARGFAYELVVDEAAFVADRMRADLRRAGNERRVLQRFVSELDKGEAEALRAVLKELSGR